MGKVILAADKWSGLRAPDPHLTALANGYRNKTLTGLNRICPIVYSPKEAGTYTNWAPSPYIPIDRLRVGMTTKRLRIDVNNAKGGFATAQYEVETAITDRELKNVLEDDRETYVEMKAMRGEDVVQLGMEKFIADRWQDPASFDAAFYEILAGTNLWNDPASDPAAKLRVVIKKMRLALQTLRADIGVYMSDDVYDVFTEHPKVITRAVGTTGDDPDETRIAKMLRVGEVGTLAGSYSVTVDETAPDNSVSADLWSNICLVTLAAPAKPSPTTPIPGAIVRTDGMPEFEEYVDHTVAGGPATVKVVKDNWGYAEISKKRVYAIRPLG